MSHDPHLPRFMSYYHYSLFYAYSYNRDNFVQMFVGWEGVGYAHIF
jgi:NADH:ubiquinone oxidoreductase subunit 5 (subunit L)/multisubunit Na+/H+ antiporter MnhA subunit